MRVPVILADFHLFIASHPYHDIRRPPYQFCVGASWRLAHGFVRMIGPDSSQWKGELVTAPSSTKTSPGNFFEDFRLGQTIQHATPRTVTVGDVALYDALFGSRFAVQSADTFAKAIDRKRVV